MKTIEWLLAERLLDRAIDMWPNYSIEKL